MHCPFCGATETKVIDSRLANDGSVVRRRRECLTCVERFTSFETADLSVPRIIKQDGSREPFDEVKLRAGMSRALEKRPINTETIEAVIARTKSRMRATGDREVSSSQIGEWIMTELREIDQVAYVRFASVYCSFQDVSAFREEIDRLDKESALQRNER